MFIRLSSYGFRVKRKNHMFYLRFMIYFTFHLHAIKLAKSENKDGISFVCLDYF